MAESSILYFNYNHGISPSEKPPQPYTNTYALSNKSKKVVDRISAHQLNPNFIASLRAMVCLVNETKEYEKLRDSLSTGKPMILGMAVKQKSWMPVGHAVVAYEIICYGDMAAIQVYDSVHPCPDDRPPFVYNLSSGDFYYDGVSGTVVAFVAMKAEPLIFRNVLSLILKCPVNATITDQHGKTISDDGTNEIPGADMFITEDTKIFYLPANLTYSVDIDAYDSGTFNFTRVSPVGTDISITEFENIPLTASTKASVDIVPEETDYTMSIDYDGDGIYESNITPDVSETIEVGPILTTIEVAPSTKTLYSGNTQQFTATAKDQYGDLVEGIAIEWTSTNTAAGTVSPASTTTGSDGTATMTFTASAPGTTTIKAAYDDVSGTATVTVQNKPVESSPILRGGGGGGGGGGGPIDIDGDGVPNLYEEVEGTDPYDPCDPDPDCFACLAKLGLTPTPEPKERSAAMMSFPMPDATETATEPIAETVTPEPAAATPAPKQPGFEAVFAIASLLAVAYVTLRRKRK